MKGTEMEGHFKVSLAKSAIRIVAGVALIFNLFEVSGVLLIVAEGFGVIEEVV